MRIIIESTKSEELRAAKAAMMLARRQRIPATITQYKDAFALTVWSADDIPLNALDDTELEELTPEQSLAFMEYAERQLKNDMVARGADSLYDLLSMWTDEVLQPKRKRNGAAEQEESTCKN